jgi:hypothetical protein
MIGLRKEELMAWATLKFSNFLTKSMAKGHIFSGLFVGWCILS